ncbi:hypothetical protein D6855_06655 [Butyrivibrio sp. CB08]|uniref:LicD family protein n=1 Tax=Butyrivibrio sp. CB08 TaxID=2364879 RepID=UPI000EA98FC5|nr:LicD family protein [Butyrivibrio sp. CB08]RKM60395.1 hypothetical protein D6855_06655 [Butyrivibrio sp. CB08]
MTDLQNLDFPQDFFCDEIRDGFFVSETMKRFWAAQLVVLSEIDKVCKRHNINWYADSGTMLGAVRHKGFIPWDDDVDIAMFRDDYKRFLGYARNELPKGYRILSSEDEECENPFGRVVNGKQVVFSHERLGAFFGCPFVAGIDVFPIDRIYEKMSDEEDRMDRGNLVLSTIVGVKEEKLTDEELNQKIAQIEEANNTVIDKSDILMSLIVLFERIAQEANNENANEIAVMTEWLGRGSYVYEKKDYEDWTELPFETTKVRVPSRYRKVLKGCYGDYMVAVRGGAIHEYPVYRQQEEVFRDTLDNDPGRFFFKKENYDFDEERKSFLTQQKEMMKFIRSIHGSIQDIIMTQGMNGAAPFLESCQKAAVSIGTIIEGKYGEDTSVVHSLEQYCEKVYEASLEWTDCSKQGLDECIDLAEQQLESLVGTSPKEILFLLGRASWWDSIKDVYDKALANKEYDVKVISVPYSFLDSTQKVLGVKTDYEEFDKITELKGTLTNLYEYNIEKKRPDKIVIQFPYDGHSSTLLIPEELYSEKLKSLTDELIFVPYLEPDPPESEEDVAYASLQELLEQPAVFNSDKMLVGSNRLKEFYVKKLMEMTDETLKDYWEKKLSIKESSI